jgi:hypothetical protein
MRNDDNAARELAFRLLARVVTEYIETGRRPRGAALKPELQRRTGGFSESLIGYESFGAFLEAAAENGFVQLHRIPGGDIEVSLPGSEPTRSEIPLPILNPEPARSGYIRRDLWRCFLDWTPGWIRLYDPQNDKAVMFPENPSPFDNPEHIRLRTAWKSAPHSFVAISPISMEKQLAWMREFANTLEEPSRSALAKALGGGRPFAAFTQLVRETPGLARDWSSFRVVRVSELISQWLNDHQLKASIEAPPLTAAPAERGTRTEIRRSSSFRAERLSGTQTTEDVVRTRLHQAIDRMTLADLLRLSVPAQYLILER